MPHLAPLGYQVKTQDIAVAGGLNLNIRSLLDIQQYFDPEGEAEDAGISAASWPLFGLVWPSAQKLADLMQAYTLGERRILEIGCGLALASMVVHRRHGDITASDCHPLTETFLNANLQLNTLPALKYSTGNWDRANPELGQFDLIIGSDILYERNQPAALALFIDLHAAARAEVLIIDPNRGNRSAFNRQMAGHGFQLDETLINTPLHDGSAYKGRLLRYRRGD
ncbi:class I SAM-dependent methyltransferase [Iodobacter fluviatilis]|uniref:Lysine methyltransferase n=1 Tax=Iodobacter fluviatilis TaxID=537 RepID=A0A377Q5Q6_9NEIS|nr:SAM-dependent methyltransferase [Iodobacter fluviatilis]TCU90144.1 lysine methyltransferase [Iodobacter fluviatilis]STQ89171.1 Predicted methyltransferase [Iodobacter fluviatilis]